jgi:hypothetical protein
VECVNATVIYSYDLHLLNKSDCQLSTHDSIPFLLERETGVDLRMHFSDTDCGKVWWDDPVLSGSDRGLSLT